MKTATFFIRVAAALVVTASTPAFAESWTNYQGNPSHTGHTAISVDPDQFQVLWDRTIRAEHDLNPVTAADGKVFVSEVGYFSDAGLWVLDAATGETIWSVTYGSINSVNPPGYAYGNVYIQTGNHSSDTWLRAYNADTGEEVFTAPFQAQWESYYAPTIYEGKIYIDGGYYGGMYGFDAYTGDEDWYIGLPQYDRWTPAVDDQFAYAYVGDYQPGLYIVDRFTGQQTGFIPDGQFDWNGWSMNLAPVLGSNGNVLAIHDGRLISFDVANDTIAWEDPRNYTGQVSLADGEIYAIDDGDLSVGNESDGAILWSWPAPEGSTLIGTILVTDSHVFTRDSAVVYAIDRVTHDDVWAYETTGHLALSDETLYIAGAAGFLTAIDLTSSPQSCEGDANGDGTVDPLDAGFVLSRLGCAVGQGDATCDASDQNADGVVDPLDSGFVLSRFGICP